MAWKVPLFDVDLGEEEIRAVAAVLESGWLTQGPKVEELEKRFADSVGSEHAIAVSSCTAALHLAMTALGIGDGDEVIVPSLTFAATANAVRYVRAQPVFADITSEDDWNISPQDVERKISSKTRAVLVLHYGGYVADMNALHGILAPPAIKIVEDCAHAPGAGIGSVKCGNFGVAGCFSFFSNKNITTGEGGMLTTNDGEVAAAVRALRSHGLTTPTLERHKGHAFSYDVLGLGFNYRLDEMRAALGLVQLGKLKAKNERRAQVAGLYRQRLSSVLGLEVPFSAPLGTPAYHIFPVLLPGGADRNRVMTAMRDDGVQTSIHYRPLHTMTAFRDAAAGAPLSNLEGIAARILTLPLYPAMGEREVDVVVSSLSRALKAH